MEKKLETQVNKVQIFKERNLFNSTGSVVHVNVDIPSDIG